MQYPSPTLSTYRSKFSEIPLLGSEIMRSSRQSQTEMSQDEVSDIFALNAYTAGKLKRWTDDPRYFHRQRKSLKQSLLRHPKDTSDRMTFHKPKFLSIKCNSHEQELGIIYLESAINCQPANEASERSMPVTLLGDDGQDFLRFRSNYDSEITCMRT